METNTKTQTLSGLSVRLNDLLIQQAAEQTRIEKIAPQGAGYVLAKDITPEGKAMVVAINAKPDKTQKEVNALKALGLIVKVPAGKIDDKELTAIKSINEDIKVVLGQIKDLTKAPKSFGTRAAPSANGANAKPEGYYKVTDQIRKAMNIRNETKVGKDIIATYDINGKEHRSKIVNAAIAYHKLQAK